jgi:hypothetical protein
MARRQQADRKCICNRVGALATKTSRSLFQDELLAFTQLHPDSLLSRLPHFSFHFPAFLLAHLWRKPIDKPEIASSGHCWPVC